MQHLPLETIVERLSAQLLCGQEELCAPILQQITRGKPLTQAALQTSLQMSRNELEQRLAKLPDTEFDQQGNIVGWGITLVPTAHRFQIGGQSLYTWCAFDTLLFPPFLQAPALVLSTCPITRHPITFVTSPQGEVKDLTPASAVLSLTLPAERDDCVRSKFCEQSLFFRSEQVASAFLADHPEAFLLSIEEAASVGRLVAQNCLKAAN
jgi:alkylmercury lyase